MFSPHTEIEFARTAIALGQPVNAEALISIAEDAFSALQEGEPTRDALADSVRANAEARAATQRAQTAEWNVGQLARAIKDAVAELRKERLSAKDRARTASILENAAKRILGN